MLLCLCYVWLVKQGRGRLIEVMPQYCCVPGCRERRGDHRFPSDPVMCLKWRVAIKREDEKGKIFKPKSRSAVVCHKHFAATDYIQSSLMGGPKRLRTDAVPSIFDCQRKILKPANASRLQRLQKRQIINHESSTGTEDSEKAGVELLQDLGNEITVGLPEVDATESGNTDEIADTRNFGVQCRLPVPESAKLSIKNYLHNPKAIQYYTGFDNYEHFQYFFQILGPAAFCLNYRCAILSPEDQFFLALMKVRQVKEDLELFILFHVSQGTVSKLVTVWTNFLYLQLKEINIWPSKDVVLDTMLHSFKLRFPTTRVILDATEIPIHKPSIVNAQSATFSTYKNRNTLKTMIGCTPRGLVSYISDSYGGSTSDRQIIERSELCDQAKFQRKDSVMADRGITVQDLFAAQDVKVNIPTMLKGKSQLEPEDVREYILRESLDQEKRTKSLSMNYHSQRPLWHLG